MNYRKILKLPKFTFLFKLIGCFTWGTFRFIEKFNGKYRVLAYILSPPNTVFPINILHWCGTFVKTELLKLTKHY